MNHYNQKIRTHVPVGLLFYGKTENQLMPTPGLAKIYK